MSLLSAVETKVKASSLASAAVGVVVALLNDVENDHALLGPVPAPLQVLILIFLPPLVSFLAGWSAKHSPRTASAAASVAGDAKEV
jgi:hypothetical protein